LGVGQRANSPHHKKLLAMKYSRHSQTWTDSLAQPKHWKTDMSLGTWNVRMGLLKVAAVEFGKYHLDLVSVQEVGWEKGGTEQTDYCTFFYGERTVDNQLGTGFFILNKIMSAVRRAEFVSDKILYIILRGY
jgi:hypothetical protein